MAGVTDRPFRQLCKQLGAGYAVSEMISSNSLLRNSEKTQRRANHDGECAPIAVQIAGANPAMMADATRYNIDRGAKIIDINLGCPAKKVCNVAAGSALMRNTPLVRLILEAVIKAAFESNSEALVTLKMRTGWDQSHKNAVEIALMAQDIGVAMLTVHGRTREDMYRGQAEYETIAQVKAAVRIPVVANGDIDTPTKAKWVLEKTQADALMIGRAAQGRPWLFREIHYFLNNQKFLPPPAVTEIQSILLKHLEDHYAFYGEQTGVRTARKHIAWYTRSLANSHHFRQRLNNVDDIKTQWTMVKDFFDEQKTYSPQLVYDENLPFNLIDASPDFKKGSFKLPCSQLN